MGQAVVALGPVPAGPARFGGGGGALCVLRSRVWPAPRASLLGPGKTSPALDEPRSPGVQFNMASTTITLNEPAYTRLKMLKRPGQSFSEVVLEYLHVPAETAGELLEYIESQPPAAGLNVERMEKALKHRKRRSRRDR